MKRAIIGCGIIKSDIEQIVESLPYECDVFWMDESLHDRPERLHDVLQEKINELCDYDEIILTFMLCGNGLLGLKSETSRLVFMLGDDCVYATMCDRADYSDLRRTSIFTSRAWLNTKKNTLEEYERSVKRYGEKRAKSIFEMMYKNYKNIVYMQLEPEVSLASKQKAENMAKQLGLELLYKEGSLDFYKELFDVSHASSRICVLEPGNAVTADMFMRSAK